ncbi:MAG: hypothetical protein M1822_001548 [Bathelium mastoideum]|nr:MAG: hypothetical protein M1822_001548 [Bathelium mastoideum]
MFNKPPGREFLKMMTDVPNEGLIHFRGFFYRDRLLLTDPKALAEVLVTKTYDYEKPSRVRNFLRNVLGDGLIIVEGDEHRFQRKHIMPVFSFRHIKDLYPSFWSKAIALTQGLAAEISETPTYSSNDKAQVSGVIEINHWANKVTMDIIGLAGLGREFNALKNSDDELIKTYEEILEPSNEKVLYFTLNILLGTQIVKLLPWRQNKRMRVTTSKLREICRQLVRDKRELIKRHDAEQIDILSILIKSNDFSDDQLVDQLLTFLAAGHETTSSAFTWTAHMLAIHPDIQSRLRAEVHQHVPSPSASSSSPTIDLASILESLPLLNAVCNETLRMYPTVPVTIRDSIRPTSILGHPVPTHTQVLLVPWATNRSPHLWGDRADEFVPERWIDFDAAAGQRPEDGRPNNHGGSSSNYNILTFLHGPRSCIGQGFAKAELRALVAAFVGCYEWGMADPDEVVVPSGVVTTKPAHGMRWVIFLDLSDLEKVRVLTRNRLRLSHLGTSW